jgi:GT2 family glycosyltransferase
VGKVAVVIPNWNGSVRLAKLLAALELQSHPIERVIVVDNGSSDDSVAIARRAGCTVIELEKNTGFSPAVNCGIRSADAEWIGILNNDVLPEPNWLAALMAQSATKDVWFMTGKLLDTSRHDRIDGTFDAVCRGGCAWRCGHGRPDSPLWNQPRQIHFPPLTAAILRADLFERVGLLDEDFESYLEDIDFGIRCAQAGLSGLYVPEAVAYHEGSATLGSWHPVTVRKISRNQLLLIAKHYPRKWISCYSWPIFVAQGLWGLTALRHGAFIAYLTGKLDGLRRFGQTKGNHQASLPAILHQSESDILELQRLTGFDLYWRLYFAMT